MDVQFGPNSVEEPNLLYKVQRKVKVFNTQDPLPNRGYNLVTSSSKYALVFVGTPDGYLSTYPLKNLIDNNLEPQHMIIKLQEKPTHIAVSCDQELLAVTGGQLLCVYKVANFQAQNVTPALSLRCDTNPSTFVSAMQWNPCIPDSIAIVFFDGTLLACQVSTSQVKKVQSKGRCLCWSPKGKQFVTGNSDGTLTQYKPDLTPAKSVPAPNLFEGCPVETMAVYWISTFQFAVVYKNATDNSRPAVTILNTPKAVQPTCLNYEDICFSMGSNRPWYYYLQGLAPWNMILSSSSNSMEIATMGSGDGASWVQWSLADEARAELPFTDKKVENYPIGISIDTSAIHQLPWGENETLPYMPLLLALSQTGLLSLFNIINLNKQAPQLCSPPQPIALPNAALTTAIPGEAPEQPVQATQTQQLQVQAPQQLQVQAPQTQQLQVQAPQQTAQVQAPQSLQAALAQPPAQLSIPQPVAPAALKPQPAPQYQPPAQTPQMPPSSASQFGSSLSSSGTAFGGFQQPQAISAFGLAEPKTQVEVKPTPTIQPAASVIQKPTPQVAAPPPKPEQSQEALAAAKAEQERLKAAKLKSMLLKEVNDFQMDLHKFIVKSRGSLGEKIMQEIHSNFNTTAIDAQQLKKDCSMDEVRSAVMQVKLELVRASAVLSEARALAEAKSLHEWTQADPLTTKRVASVQKLAYYVQNQIEQAYKALDHKWNSVARDNKLERPGQRMIRPVLDDVYQPLVKQQEILCRQEAVLRTLKNSLKEVDTGPMFKSTSLLRSTPFRNNKDPLSKLTKNILNMSIEPETKLKGPLLSAQKLDALRDMLSNHKTIKVKPVNVELREQIAAMRLSYEKNLKEKAAAQLEQEAAQARQQEAAQARQQEAAAQLARERENAEMQRMVAAQQSQIQRFAPKQMSAAPDLVKFEPKEEIVSPISVPSFTPVGSKPMPGLANVARTLFVDEPKAEPVKAVKVQPKPVAPPQNVFNPKPASLAVQPPTSAAVQPLTSAAIRPPAADNTRSVLKDLLQKKQANNAAKEANAFANNANTFANNANTFAKGDANTFMGQKICSPTAFSFNAPNVESSEPSAFSTNKPPVRVLDTKNMFSSFQSPAFAIESKPKSSETGEPEATDPKKPLDIKKDDKPLTNLFGSKPVLTSNIGKEPTLQKPQDVPKTDDKVPIKVALKAEQKAKENMISEKAALSLLESPKPATDKKESDVKPLGTQSLNFGSSPSANVTAPSESQKPVELKAEIRTEAPKTEEKSTPPKLSLETSNASSLFAAANASSPTAAKPQPLFGSAAPITTQSSTPSSPQPTSPAAVSDTTEKVSVFTTPVSSPASSLFSSAVASQESKTTQAGSIFSTATSNASVFANTGSLFGSGAASTTSSVFGTSKTQEVLTSEAKPSVFSTSTPATDFGAASTTQSVIASSPSVFAQAATTTAQSVFASAAPGSIFGTATTQASAFGTSTSTTSVFGTPATTAASLFGSPATSQASVFGSPATTAQSVFGSTNATTQAASVFGGAVQSVFGSSPTTPQASMFGAPASQSSVFGSAPPSTQASVFGSSATSTTQSVFGSTPATTTQSSLFGGAESSLFASASISTTSAPTQNSGGSIFGGSPQGSVFGGGATNVFGGKTAFSQSNPTAAAIFGGGTAFGQKPQQASSFWGSNTGGTATTGFGSGFGQQAQAAPTTSMFGSSGGSFSAPSAAGQAFGNTQAPAFGAAENKPSVFGSPQQQASPGFGGSPVFGGKTVFGQQSPGFGTPPAAGFGGFGGFNKSPSSGFGAPAAFGGGATFGGAPAFGSTSPGKMFGGSPQGGGAGFGAPTQSNAMFEDLATQNTLTFGNLAQQSGQAPAPAAPTFNTSPAFSGWRG